MQINQILEMILTELDRAEKLYPDWPENIVCQGAIISEEAGEACKAINDHYWHNKSTKAEIAVEVIQTAAMCIRFLKHL